MSPDIKICFKSFYDTFNEIVEEGCKRQGRDVLPFFQEVWEVQLAACAKEAEWRATKYVPSYDEYMESASVSVSLGTLVLISAIFTREILTDDVLSKIGRASRFHYLMGVTGRLVNDTKTYKAERGQGEEASAVECYMKDHPEISEEEALEHVYTVMDNALDELNREFVNNNDVPDSCRRLIFETAKIAQLFYIEADGLTFSHNMEIKEHVEKCLFQPVT